MAAACRLAAFSSVVIRGFVERDVNVTIAEAEAVVPATVHVIVRVSVERTCFGAV